MMSSLIMKLLIKSLNEATEFVPENKTYAIRISSEYDFLEQFEHFLESDNWVEVNRYLFDDVWPGMQRSDDVIYGRETMFSVEKGIEIIEDLKEHISDIETILVVCTYGQNRSPSVGLALNDIFELGHDSASLKEEHPRYRPFIYNTMLEAAEDLGMI